jgi:hypothetical protein
MRLSLYVVCRHMAHVDERLGTDAIDRAAAAVLTAPGTQNGDDSAGIKIAGDVRFSLNLSQK